MISWYFPRNTPSECSFFRGHTDTDGGVGQWLCVLLPFPRAGAKHCAVFPWRIHASLSSAEEVFVTALICQERGLPCHLHYGEEPWLIYMQAAKPREFSASHESHLGDAWPKTTSLHFMLKLDQKYVMCVRQRVIKFVLK